MMFPPDEIIAEKATKPNNMSLTPKIELELAYFFLVFQSNNAAYTHCTKCFFQVIHFDLR